MSLAENPQYLRAREGVTQEQLAERLDVSRQSVSKWESNTSYPEMETILKLCDMFHVDMDTLLRGSVEKSLSEDTVGYDRFMTLYARKIAGGVSAIIAGAALAALTSARGLPDMAGAAVLLLVVAAATVVFIASGMEEENFRKKHPTIPDFYTEAQKDSFRRRKCGRQVRYSQVQPSEQPYSRGQGAPPPGRHRLRPHYDPGHRHIPVRRAGL